MKNKGGDSIFILLLILAIVLIAVFTKMTLYVVGSLIGVLIVLIVYFVRKRKH